MRGNQSQSTGGHPSQPRGVLGHRGGYPVLFPNDQQTLTAAPPPPRGTGWRGEVGRAAAGLRLRSQGDNVGRLWGAGGQRVSACLCLSPRGRLDLCAQRHPPRREGEAEEEPEGVAGWATLLGVWGESAATLETGRWIKMINIYKGWSPVLVQRNFWIHLFICCLEGTGRRFLPRRLPWGLPATPPSSPPLPWSCSSGASPPAPFLTRRAAPLLTHGPVRSLKTQRLSRCEDTERAAGPQVQEG